MTSSDLRDRRARPCSPSAQRSASARLLLPEPFGPTTALIPGPNSTIVRSANDLKPWSRSARSRAGAVTAAPGSPAGSAGRLGPEKLDRPLGGRGFRHPPRGPLPGPEGATVDDDLHLEQLLVVGPRRIDDVVDGSRTRPSLRVLLQPALRALQG